MGNYLTVAEVAAELHVHKDTVCGWIRTGRLKARRNIVSRRVLIPKEELEAFRTANLKDWTPQPDRRPLPRKTQSTPNAKGGEGTGAGGSAGSVGAGPAPTVKAPPNPSPPPKPPVTSMPKKNQAEKDTVPPPKTAATKTEATASPPKKSFWDDEPED